MFNVDDLGIPTFSRDAKRERDVRAGGKVVEESKTRAHMM